MKSGVIGASPTRPRMPSVPKYLLLLPLSAIDRHCGCADDGVVYRQRVPGRSDVVHAHNGCAAFYRHQRRGDAAVDAIAGCAAGDFADGAFARPADQHRHAKFCKLAELAQKHEVMRCSLAETETRVDGDALAAYAGGFGGG